MTAPSPAAIKYSEIERQHILEDLAKEAAKVASMQREIDTLYDQLETQKTQIDTQLGLIRHYQSLLSNAGLL